MSIYMKQLKKGEVSKRIEKQLEEQKKQRIEEERKMEEFRKRQAEANRKACNTCKAFDPNCSKCKMKRRDTNYNVTPGDKNVESEGDFEVDSESCSVQTSAFDDEDLKQLGNSMNNLMLDKRQKSEPNKRQRSSRALKLPPALLDSKED